MGLTIHYRIAANPDWTRRQIRQKLEDTRRFALSLPVVSVGEVAEFRGKDCDWQAGGQEGETPDEADVRDPFRWAKIQASRSIESPWRPGVSRMQSPSHMLCLSIGRPRAAGDELGLVQFLSLRMEAEQGRFQLRRLVAGLSQPVPPSRVGEDPAGIHEEVPPCEDARPADEITAGRSIPKRPSVTVDGASVTIWASYLSHAGATVPAGLSSRCQITRKAGLATGSAGP